MTNLGAIAQGSKRKLQGLAFLLVVALLLALTIAIYNKTFQATVPITLLAQRAGEQLDLPADVMVRGIEVGQVRAEQVTRGYAKLDIALYPADVHLIPANVTAEILPETLFGEKYVDLVLPARPAAPIRPHAVIGLDRSTTALETDQLFNNLLPLLRALHPAQLSETLTALANALSGRGAELGANLAGADTYFKGFNPHLGVFEADITGLANVAGDYSAAAQNILALARNFSFNARTLVEKQDTFAAFLAGTAGFANTMTAVLQQNEANLILLPAASLPTLQVLARYAPEYTCLIDGLVKLDPLLQGAFGALPGSHTELHITLIVNQNQGAAYTYPTDLPKYGLNSGPNCDGLPVGPSGPGYAPPQPGSLLQSDASIGLAGSPAENAAIAAIAAPILGVPAQQVPGFADLLVGPVLRGEVVSYS